MSDGPATTPAETAATAAATDTGAVESATDSTMLTASAEENSTVDADSSADTGDTGSQGEGTQDAGTDTGEGNQSAPDTYADFTLPEGMSLDADLLSEAAPIFKELNLTQEQAQKLVDLQVKQVQAGSDKQIDTFNQLMTDWQEQSKNDSEFGGDKFDASIKTARNAIDKFGSDGLKQLLDQHGVGNHPEMIRFMVRVGSLLAEDNPGGTTTPASKAKDRVSTLYPNN